MAGVILGGVSYNLKLNIKNVYVYTTLLLLITPVIIIIFIKQNKTIETFGIIQATLSAAWILYLLIYFVNVINTRAWRTKSKWAIFRGPIITLVIILARSVLGFIILS